MIVTAEERKKTMELMLPTARAALDKGLSYQVAKAYFEFCLMQEALQKANGSIVHAALYLGINRNWATTLVRVGGLQHLVVKHRNKKRA